MNLDGTLETHEIDALVAYHASRACNVSQWRVLWSMIPSDVRDLVLRDAMRILKKQDPMVWQHIADFE